MTQSLEHQSKSKPDTFDHSQHRLSELPVNEVAWMETASERVDQLLPDLIHTISWTRPDSERYLSSLAQSLGLAWHEPDDSPGYSRSAAIRTSLLGMSWYRQGYFEYMTAIYPISLIGAHQRSNGRNHLVSFIWKDSHQTSLQGQLVADHISVDLNDRETTLLETLAPKFGLPVVNLSHLIRQEFETAGLTGSETQQQAREFEHTTILPILAGIQQRIRQYNRTPMSLEWGSLDLEAIRWLDQVLVQDNFDAATIESILGTKSALKGDIIIMNPLAALSSDSLPSEWFHTQQHSWLPSRRNPDDLIERLPLTDEATKNLVIQTLYYPQAIPKPNHLSQSEWQERLEGLERYLFAGESISHLANVYGLTPSGSSRRLTQTIKYLVTYTGALISSNQIDLRKDTTFEQAYDIYQYITHRLGQGALLDQIKQELPVSTKRLSQLKRSLAERGLTMPQLDERSIVAQQNRQIGDKLKSAKIEDLPQIFARITSSFVESHRKSKSTLLISLTKLAQLGGVTITERVDELIQELQAADIVLGSIELPRDSDGQMYIYNWIGFQQKEAALALIKRLKATGFFENKMHIEWGPSTDSMPSTKLLFDRNIYSPLKEILAEIGIRTKAELEQGLIDETCPVTVIAYKKGHYVANQDRQELVAYLSQRL